MLTPAKKKYLFSIYEIGLQKAIIRSVDIAKSIRISKASVCNMLPILVEDGLIEKDADRIVALTDEGADIAEAYYSIYKFIYRLLRNKFESSKESAREDAINFVCNLTDENIENMKNCFLVDAAR